MLGPSSVTMNKYKDLMTKSTSKPSETKQALASLPGVLPPEVLAFVDKLTPEEARLVVGAMESLTILIEAYERADADWAAAQAHPTAEPRPELPTPAQTSRPRAGVRATSHALGKAWSLRPASSSHRLPKRSSKLL